VLRGTFIKVSEKSGYLWTSGFKERIRTYDGMEVPVPMKIDVLHGDANVEGVARDVLSLTKLNYNACKLGDSLPVTVHFSDAVGEILVNNPKTQTPRPNFKYYI
jgi:argonaute-like protein implicated in RNA metabolism and viral defense